MKSIYTLFSATLFLTITSCQLENGGIQEIELTLDTVPFDRIRLESGADTRIIQSDNYQVVIRGEERDVNDVDVRVIADQLTIEEHGSHSSGLIIYIYVPELSQLEHTGSSLVYGESNFTQDRNMDILLSGSGEIDFAVYTDDVDLDLTGSGYVYLEGSVQTLDADISGSGWLRSFTLDTDLADVRIEGSGSAEVSVDTDLDIFISGSGDVYYKGHPAIYAEITGSGSVIDAN